jgi:hypothetical protein
VTTTTTDPLTSDPEVREAQAALLAHPVYERVSDFEDLQVFMEHHVWAVWDFFTFAKRLQREVTCVELPWTPPADRASAFFVNEIVLGEESDELPDGGHASHFELYLMAMSEVGADSSSIERFIGNLPTRADVFAALAAHRQELPGLVYSFLERDFDLALNGKPHEVAAAFYLGREDAIPGMFERLLAALPSTPPLDGLRYYLERHIELDGDEHGPLAAQLVANLVRGDETRQEEARRAALRALHARMLLWDGVIGAI